MSEFAQKCFQKIRLWIRLLRENDGFCIFPVFLKSMILEKKFTMRRILNWNIYNVSDFEKKIKKWENLKKKLNLQKHIIKFVTRKKRRFLHCPSFSESINLEKKTYKPSNFELKPSQRFRFWPKFIKTSQNLKKKAFKKSRFELFCFAKTTDFAISVLFRQAMFEK